jgi:hypothetical protein
VTYTLHYVSADGPGPGATYSVYREQYAERGDSEPIDGTQEFVSQHPNAHAAQAESARLQRLTYLPEDLTPEAVEAWLST